MRPRAVVVLDPFGDERASVVEAEEQALVEQLSRILPLKLSTKPFCMGLPGAM